MNVLERAVRADMCRDQSTESASPDIPNLLRPATEDELRDALDAQLGEDWTPQPEALAAARRRLPDGSANALRRMLHRAVRDGLIEERGGENGAPELRRATAAERR